MNKNLKFIRVDIESDGPMVGINSMRSIGAVEVNRDLSLGYKFYKTIEKHGTEDPDTMKFWDNHPQAYAELNKHPKPAGLVIQSFDSWLGCVCGKDGGVIFVTDALWYDYAWVRWYLLKYVGRDIFFDTGRWLPYTSIATGAKIRLPDAVSDFPHCALDDAISIANQFRSFLIHMKEYGLWNL